MSLYHGTKRTFKVLRRRSDVEGRADMARTLPQGDPRYATDFLPRGAAGSWWPWPRLCEELRTQELAGVLWPTWRRFDPSSSPSAISLKYKANLCFSMVDSRVASARDKVLEASMIRSEIRSRAELNCPCLCF